MSFLRGKRCFQLLNKVFGFSWLACPAVAEVIVVIIYKRLQLLCTAIRTRLLELEGTIRNQLISNPHSLDVENRGFMVGKELLNSEDEWVKVLEYEGHVVLAWSHLHSQMAPISMTNPPVLPKTFSALALKVLCLGNQSRGNWNDWPLYLTSYFENTCQLTKEDLYRHASQMCYQCQTGRTRSGAHHIITWSSSLILFFFLLTIYLFNKQFTFV